MWNSQNFTPTWCSLRELLPSSACLSDSVQAVHAVSTLPRTKQSKESTTRSTRSTSRQISRKAGTPIMEMAFMAMSSHTSSGTTFRFLSAATKTSLSRWPLLCSFCSWSVLCSLSCPFALERSILFAAGFSFVDTKRDQTGAFLVECQLTYQSLPCAL